MSLYGEGLAETAKWRNKPISRRGFMGSLAVAALGVAASASAESTFCEAYAIKVSSQ